jgi:hypothetical protein
MFNPLQPFEERFIEMFRRKGVKAFVRQTYNRGNGFVLIHFENMLAAQQYFDVVKTDPARELILLDKAGEERIKELLRTEKIYTMLKIRDAEFKVKKLLEKRIRCFIDTKLGWNPGRNDDVQFGLDVQFGEVYAKLKFRAKEIKVKLEDIEK